LSINGALIGREVADAANYYTISPNEIANQDNSTALALAVLNNTYSKSSLVLKNQPAGEAFPIYALVFDDTIANDSPRYSNTNFVVEFIPSDSQNAVKGSDGNIYLKYSNNTYRQFFFNDTPGPVLAKLP
jgi:hypothetical protein